MQVTGKVVKVLPTTTYGKDNKKKGGFVISCMDGKYEKKIAFTVFETNLPKLDNVKEDSTVEVEFKLDSREWQGKWFTDAVAWDIKVSGSVASAPKKEEFQVEDKYGNLPF